MAKNKNRSAKSRDKRNMDRDIKIAGQESVSMVDVFVRNLQSSETFIQKDSLYYQSYLNWKGLYGGL